MSIIYKLHSKKNPMDSSDVKYFARRVSTGTVDTETLAQEIAVRAGQSEGTVLGLLEDLNEEILSQLMQSYKVRLGNVGVVSLRFKGAGVDSEDDYRSTNIDRVKLNLKASSTLKNAVSVDDEDVSFVKYE